MNKLLITVLILSTFALMARADIYAVLAAGSKGYSNYRHQSDICHAYQVLVNNGVPKSNIIVFAYNDIAHNPSNPFPGTMFNKPSSAGETSPNVYEGCEIDYEGEEVTPENYVAVLTGDKDAVKGVGTGRVLESGPDDEVFLNFDDHGAKGYICFPEIGEWPSSKSQQLYADELNDTFEKMYQNKQYKQLTYYLETCYSGSMFEDTPTNTGIYAVSAANPNQSSYGCYCGSEAKVEGKSIGSCLGDLFSVNWMDNTESTNTNEETLQEQWQIVHDETAATPPFYSDGSEVMQWGDLSFTSSSIGTFLGSKNQANQGTYFLKKLQKAMKQAPALSVKKGSVQKTEEIQTNYLLSKFQENPDLENYLRLNQDLEATAKFNAVFEIFNTQYSIRGAEISGKHVDFDCYRYLLNSLENKCGPLNDFSRGLSNHLYEFCGTHSNAQYQAVSFNC